MSDGEAAITVLSLIISVPLWIFWYHRVLGVRLVGPPASGRLAIAMTPLVCAALIFTVLRTLASHDVVDDARYMVMYLLLGMFWVGIAALSFGWFGITARDDVLERRNNAAVPVITGGLMGVACCYAGGNIGDGPGWWVVIFAGLIATGGFVLLWGLLEKLTAISESITIDRDLAAGYRLGGFLLASGIILGRSVAGDWVSAGATIADCIRTGWPVLALFALAIVVERAAKPSVAQPEPPAMTLGLMPALLYVGGAAAWVAWLGLPGGPS